MSLRMRALLIGLAVSATLLAIVAARMDWHEFRAAFAGVRWTAVALGCAGVVLTITLRALRWAAFSGARGAQFGAYWNATVLGYVGNALYPGRAGELLRIAALHRALRLPPGELLAKALADRMADVIVLGVAALWVVGVLATDLARDVPLGWLVLIMLIPVGGFAAFVACGARLAPLVSRLSARLPGRWRERFPRWYAQVLSACGELARPARLFPALAITIVAFCVDYAVLWFFLRAFEWELPVHAAMTVGVLLAIGSMLPAAPGYIGIYQVACVVALAPYGIGESPALAYSVVAQGATLLIIGVLGAFVALRWGLHRGLSARLD